MFLFYVSFIRVPSSQKWGELISMVIEISEKVDRVSYYFEGQWKQVWPLVE